MSEMPNEGAMAAEDARQAYYDYTAQASAVLRQLGFAAIAVIWLFKSAIAAQIQLPRLLVVSALLTVGALSLDLLQYLYASAAWGIFNGLMERRDLQSAYAPRSINWVTLIC